MHKQIQQIKSELQELQAAVNEVLTTVDERLSILMLNAIFQDKVSNVPSPVNTSEINILPDIKNLIEGNDLPWTASLPELSDYAFIRIKSVNGNDIIYEKGARRFVAKMKKPVTPIFDFFEVDKFYVVKYNIRERWAVEWAQRLDISNEDFIKLAKKLAGRVMHLKEE